MKPESQPTLLLIDDDRAYSRHFVESMSDAFSVLVVQRFEDLHRLLEHETLVQGIFVDLNVESPRDGEAFVRGMRQRGYAGSLFALTTDESVSSKVALLEARADDYLWKAMPPAEMKARVQRVLELRKGATLARSELGNLTLDRRDWSCRVGTERLELSKLELKLLSLLMDRYPTAVAPQEAAEAIWGKAFVEAGAIRTCLYQINQKLSHWDFTLRNQKGFGVRLQSKRT